MLTGGDAHAVGRSKAIIHRSISPALGIIPRPRSSNLSFGFDPRRACWAMGPTYEFRHPALPPMAIMPKSVICRLGPWPNTLRLKSNLDGGPSVTSTPSQTGCESVAQVGDCAYPRTTRPKAASTMNITRTLDICSQIFQPQRKAPSRIEFLTPI